MRGGGDLGCNQSRLAYTKYNVAGLLSRLGFTLAEVLIALGIIGIVAAITMPTLIQNHKEKTTVVKVKRMYSVLSQAYTMYLQEGGYTLLQVNSNSAKIAFNVFKPYLKVMKDCGTSRGAGCISTDLYLLKSGGKHNVSYSSSNYYKVILTDGSSIWFRGGGNNAYWIDVFYDVNGPKGPNRWGYDLFEFLINNSDVAPGGVPDRGVSGGFNENCASKNSTGFGCAAWVVYKENMDYLKCDNLRWNGKSSCK